MFDDLNSAFPDHDYFYEVSGLTLNEAMEYCARLSAGNPHIFNFNGKVIFASQQPVSTTDISWLTEVPGSPTILAEDVSATPSE
jgi:hypothetical protein